MQYYAILCIMVHYNGKIKDVYKYDDVRLHMMLYYDVFQMQSSVQTQITGENNRDNDYSSPPLSSPVFWVHL